MGYYGDVVLNSQSIASYGLRVLMPNRRHDIEFIYCIYALRQCLRFVSWNDDFIPVEISVLSNIVHQWKLGISP